MTSILHDLGITRPRTPKIPPALQFDTGTPFPVACSRLYPDRDVDIYALTILPFDNERKAVVSAGDSAAHVVDLSTTLVTVSLPGRETMETASPREEDASPSRGLFTRVVKTSISKHGPARRSLLEHKGAVLAVDCALPNKKPDEPVILTGSVAELGRVWFPSTLEQFAVLHGHRAPVYGVALSYSVDRAITASGDSTLRVWLLEDIYKRALVTTPKSNKQGNMKRALSFRKNKDDGTEEQTGGARTLAILRGHIGEVFTVEVLDDRSSGGVLRAVSGGEDTIVHIWDLETKSILRSLQGHEKKIHAVAVPRTTEKELCGRVILSSSGDKTCRLWDIQATNPLTGVLGSHDDEVWGCAISSQGRYALTCTVGGSAYIWDLRRHSTPLSRFHSREPLRCCAASPSNRTFHTADTKGNIYHIYVGGQSPQSIDIDNAKPPGSFGYELRARALSERASLRSSQSVGRNMAYMEYLYKLGNGKDTSDSDTCRDDSYRPSSSSTKSGSTGEIQEFRSNTVGKEPEIDTNSSQRKETAIEQSIGSDLQGTNNDATKTLEKRTLDPPEKNCQIL
ncbi:Dynein assembly factor with WDR repeat domains 1 [Galdieria sulphuraria]|nr:Dynein assembly factor with WDR repeat domains 1 [Galdieria sulphuraria]